MIGNGHHDLTSHSPTSVLILIDEIETMKNVRADVLSSQWNNGGCWELEKARSLTNQEQSDNYFIDNMFKFELAQYVYLLNVYNSHCFIAVLQAAIY